MERPAPELDENYLAAVQTALEGKDAEPLLSMLDAAVPMSAVLLMPLLADVVRDAQRGRQGAPATLTASDNGHTKALNWPRSWGQTERFWHHSASIRKRPRWSDAGDLSFRKAIPIDPR